MTGVRAPMVQPMDNDRDPAIGHLAPLIGRKKISPVGLTRFLRAARDYEAAAPGHEQFPPAPAAAGGRRPEGVS